MLDPAADKLLVASLALPMAITGAIPLWLCALIVGRDVGLMAVGFWHRFKTRASGDACIAVAECIFGELEGSCIASVVVLFLSCCFCFLDARVLPFRHQRSQFHC